MSAYAPLKVSAPVRRHPKTSIEEIRGEENRSDQTTVQGSGLAHKYSPLTAKRSTNPVTSSVQREVWHHLTEGLRWLSLNDFGNDWPLPRRDRLRELLTEFDHDLCLKAARETREIVKAQDRAPNITSLFEKKLRDLAEVRATVRRELAAAGGEG
jgi:hypothetical protein